MKTNIVILALLVAFILGFVTWFYVTTNNKIDARIAENEKLYGLQSQFKKTDVKNIDNPTANFVYVKMHEALMKPELLAKLAAENNYDDAFTNENIYNNLKFSGRNTIGYTDVTVSNMTSRNAVVLFAGYTYDFKGFWAIYVGSGETAELKIPGQTCIASFLLGRRWLSDFELASSVPEVVGGEDGLHGFFLSPAPGAAELLSEGIVMKENYKYELETKRFLLGNKNGFPGYTCIMMNKGSDFYMKISEDAFEPDADSLISDTE